MSERNSRVWWKQKKIIIPVVLIVLLVGIRLVLEPVLLNIANKQAKTINPVFEGHIGDLDLSILKGGVELQDVTAKIKENGRQFLTVQEVLVDLAWKQLFKGRVQFDVAVTNFQMNFEKDLLTAIEKLPETEEKKKELPFRIAELTVHDSRIVLNEYPGLNDQKALIVNDIDGEIRNISGREGSKLGNYSFIAGLSKKDDIKISGHFDISTETPRWDMNAHLEKFDLGAGNKALSKLVPVNFRHGTLDLYSEVKSEGGKIFGYVKPFLNNVQFMGNQNEFKGAKHFFVELAGAVSRFVFEHNDKESIATRVPFIYEDGAFSVEGGGALVDAVKHGLIQNEVVPRGLEDKYQLNRANPKEVQAQEESLEKAKEKKEEKEKNQ